MASMIRIFQRGLVLLSLASRPFAKPVHLTESENGFNSAVETPRIVSRDVSSPPVLSILPVGDSITIGVGSSDVNGYRLDLETLIKAGGQQVEFIGTQTSGQNNPDNHEEGYGWFRINQILGKIQGDDVVLQQQPNLVLIHAGTNDNNAEIVGETYADAPARLANLIDFILGQDPHAILLVAMLIQNKYNQTQTDLFNAQVPNVVRERYVEGHKIRTVDMTGIGGVELSDKLHPTDTGYNDMAHTWYAAIRDVPDGWWVPNTPPPTSLAQVSDARMLKVR